METHREQRTVFKFCFKNELTATETLKMLQKAFGHKCLSRVNVFEWYGKFHNIQERGTPEPVKHRNKLQKYVLLWQTIDVQ